MAVAIALSVAGIVLAAPTLKPTALAVLAALQAGNSNTGTTRYYSESDCGKGTCPDAVYLLYSCVNKLA
jgi:hypothetical protein